MSTRRIAYGASLIVLLLGAFAFFKEVELKQSVPCEIVSLSEVKVRGVGGLVAALHVTPGQAVEQGAPLFDLAHDLSLSADGRTRSQFDAQMRDAQTRNAAAQFGARRDDLEARVKATRAALNARDGELASLDSQLYEAQQLADDAQRRLDRLTSLADYVTLDRIEQARADLHDRRAGVAQAEQRRRLGRADITSLRGTLAGLESQRGQLAADYERNVQDIAVRFEQQRPRQTVYAPSAGVVSFSGLAPGRTLDPRDVAMVIDTGGGAQALRAALTIGSRQRGFVRTGQTVRIKLDAFPYARFGTYPAQISAVSATTLDTPELNVAPPPSAAAAAQGSAAPADGVYVAWADLAGDTFDTGRERVKILSGMRGSASIVVERRTIAEWVLEPLFRVWRS